LSEFSPKYLVGLTPIHDFVPESKDGLSERQRELLRAFSLKVTNHMSHKLWDKLPQVFSAIELPSLSQMSTFVRNLSGIKPDLYDCCVNSCCAFTGLRAKDQQCDICKHPRFNIAGKPFKVFSYLPLLPRLVKLFESAKLSNEMRYRAHGHHHSAGKWTDIFDGDHYRWLLGQRVRVGDRTFTHSYFCGDRDIALGLSTDGFSPFRSRKHSAWPLIIFLYNLPPEIRFRQEFILSLGVIPGPKAVKDLDSFLYPLVSELAKLAIGVRAYDAHMKQVFALRAHLLSTFGDMPAVAKLMRMLGHIGICPCRFCDIRGVRNPSKPTATTHYVPLDRSHHPNPGDVMRYDPKALPLRTHDEMLRQAREVEAAPSASAAKRLSTAYGIKGLSALTVLHSVQFPIAFPLDFMHLIWENLIPNLVRLWTGSFKDLGGSENDFEIPSNIWTEIGRATAESGRTCPSQFGKRVPDIAERLYEFTAETWSFWALYLAPVLLRGRFRRPVYYHHFVKLIKLLQLCMQFEITLEDLDEIRSGFCEWVEKYEE
jgi:hypothetical protein